MTNVRDFPGGTKRRDLHNITGWLDNLASLTAGTIPLPDAKVKIAALATALIEEYPPAAFTRDSLMHVARQVKFFPSYGELATHLSAWWSENRPPPSTAAITGPDTGLDQNARQWVSYYRKREAEGFSPMANGNPSSRAHVLSLVKQQSPAAWQHITGDIIEPERPPTPQRRKPTTNELESVASIVSRGIEAINADYNRVYHPLNSPTAPARPEPRYLSTAELTAARQAIGAPPPKVPAG